MPRPSLREDVVAAAMEQFHRHGYQGGGVKDITNAAGLPKGSFYNYFASKEEMALEELTRYGLSRELDRLSASLPRRSPGRVNALPRAGAQRGDASPVVVLCADPD